MWCVLSSFCRKMTALSWFSVPNLKIAAILPPNYQRVPKRRPFQLEMRCRTQNSGEITVIRVKISHTCLPKHPLELKECVLFSISQLSTFLLGNIFSSPGRDRMSRHDLSGSIIINSSCRPRHGAAEDGMYSLLWSRTRASLLEK